MPVFGGLGGPGQGAIDGKAMGLPQMGGMEWLNFMGAGGYGLGPYGYPLAFGITPWGQQNEMLNRQWGWGGFGEHDGTRNLPKWWTFGAGSPGP